MVIQYYNIVTDIIKTESCFATKQPKFKKFIDSKLEKVEEETLFILDLTGAALDPYFCMAFDDILTLSLKKPSNVDVLFKINEINVSQLLGGILKAKEIEYTSDQAENVVDIFKNHQLTIKLLFPDNEMKFISKLEDDSEAVLDLINSESTISPDEIYKHQKIDIHIKNIGSVLETLEAKRFIYEKADNEYHSIKKILTEETSLL